MSRDGREPQFMQRLVDGVARTNSLMEVLIHSIHIRDHRLSEICPICEAKRKEKAA